MPTPRRHVLILLAATALTGCKPKPAKPADTKPPPATLEKVIAGEWRLADDKARDHWRHPAESLAFWGLKPGMTVVELWPGAGWYTDILAPYLEMTGGVLYEALQPADDPAAAQMNSAFAHKLKQGKRLYGEVHLSEFGPKSAALAPAGTADLVLFARNVHNWMAAGVAEKAFHDAFVALKPGGPGRHRF